MSVERTTPWGSRRYKLHLFDKDEALVISIELTAAQAERIGEMFCPKGADGIGEYDIDAYVQMGPK